MSPYRYSKSQHSRSQTPTKPYSYYKRYKPALQREFSGQCVYCRQPDYIRTYRTFHVEHYRPKSLFPALQTAYSNLFYSCATCNEMKGNYWPAAGSPDFIPNPCDHVMTKHLRYAAAKVEAVSEVGKFALELLDLNDPTVVQYRELVLHQIDLLEEKIAEIERKIKLALKRRNVGLMTRERAQEAIERLNELLERQRSMLGRLDGSELAPRRRLTA
jgi:hypothetical protein